MTTAHGRMFWVLLFGMLVATLSHCRWRQARDIGGRHGNFTQAAQDETSPNSTGPHIVAIGWIAAPRDLQRTLPWLTTLLPAGGGGAGGVPVACQGSDGGRRQGHEAGTGAHPLPGALLPDARRPAQAQDLCPWPSAHRLGPLPIGACLPAAPCLPDCRNPFRHVAPRRPAGCAALCAARGGGRLWRRARAAGALHHAAPTHRGGVGGSRWQAKGRLAGTWYVSRQR